MGSEDSALSDGFYWSYSVKENQNNQFVQRLLRRKITSACDHYSQRKQAVRLEFVSFCSLLTRESSKLQIWAYIFFMLLKKKAVQV